MPGINVFRDVRAEAQHDLGLDPEAAVIAGAEFGLAVMHLARKDRTVARLRDPAELLHDRRCQADLIAGDRTSPNRLLDLLEAAPDRVSLLEARRIDFRRQDVGRPAAAEQFDDTFSLLPRVEKGHSCLSAFAHLRGTKSTEKQCL